MICHPLIFESVYGSINNSKKNKPVVAVLPFDSNINLSDEANTLNTRFVNELHEAKMYHLVERIKLESILDEQKFQLSGCTSTECLVIVGRLVNAQFVVAGHYGNVGQFGSVSVRMIDVESGEIVKTATVDYKSKSSDLLLKGMQELAITVSQPMNQIEIKKSKPVKDYRETHTSTNKVDHNQLVEFGYHSDSYFGIDGELPNNAEGIFMTISLNRQSDPGYFYFGLDYSRVNYANFNSYSYNENDQSEGDLSIVDWAAIPYIGYSYMFPITSNLSFIANMDAGLGIKYGYEDEWDISMGEQSDVKTNLPAMLFGGGLKVSILPIRLSTGFSIAFYDVYPRISLLIGFGLPI